MKTPSTLSIAILAAACAAPAASACPQAVPAGMSAVSVADSVAVDGMGLSILQVQSRAPGAQVLARVEREWRDAGYDVKRNEVQGWQVVSALGDKCMTTLQLADGGAAFGYLALNRFAKPAPARLPPLPMPGGARVLSNVISDDDGRKASTMVLAAGQSVGDLVRFYKERLEQERWSGVRALSGAGTATKATVSAQRGRERVEVVIVRDGGSRVVVNLATEL